MSVYDDQGKNRNPTPEEELAELERLKRDPNFAKIDNDLLDRATKARTRLRNRFGKKDDDELSDPDLKDKLSKDPITDEERARTKEIQDERQALENKLKGQAKDAKNSKNSNVRQGLYAGSAAASDFKNKQGGKHKAKIVLASIGVMGSILGAFIGLIGFLSTFQLDHILNNIEAKTFVRFNAQLSRRSDNYIRAYAKMRITQWGDTVDADNNTFLRAANDDLNPLTRRWYEAMRRSELEIFGDQIEFISVVDDQGNIRQGRITFGDGGRIDLDGQNFAGKLNDKVLLKQTLNEIDNNLDLELFDSDKAARKAIKRDLKKRTRSFQVLKRRRVRKSIQVMTGIRDWRMFEKTRDRISRRTINTRNKIIRKVFPDSTQYGKFLQCLFGAGACTTSDANDTKNRHSTNRLDDLNNPRDRNLDADGGVDPNTNEQIIVDGGDNSQIDTSSGNTNLSDGIDGNKDDFRIARLLKGIIAQQIVKRASNIYGLAQMIVLVDDALAGGADSGIAKMVKYSKTVQAVAYYSSYVISRDQIKRGELVGDELTDFYSTLEFAARSEGWVEGITRSATATLASEATNAAKKAYCGTAPEEREIGSYAWHCNALKPINGGRAETIAIAYSDSALYDILHPIADATRAFNDTIIGKFLIKLESTLSNIMSSILQSVLKLTGTYDTFLELGQKLAEMISSYLGFGPIWDLITNDAANVLITGGQATAENHIRQGGGIISSATTTKTKEMVREQVLAYQDEIRSTTSNWDKFASLSNHQSIASSLVFSLSTSSAGQMASNLASAINPFNLMRGFVGVAGAQTTDMSLGLNDLAGVERYDMPSACFFDPTDLITPSAMTNADEVFDDLTVTWSMIIDNQVLFDEVYKRLDAQFDENQVAEKENIALSIYNCAEFDKQVMESLGGLAGFTVNDGLSDSQYVANSSATSVSGVNARVRAVGAFEAPDLVNYDPSQCTAEVSPGQSIASAINAGGPGSIICVHAGTYNESIYVGNGGSNGNYLVVTGYPGEAKPVLSPGYTECGFNIGASYVEISRFEIAGQSTDSSREIKAAENQCATGISVDGGHHIKIISNHVHHIPGGGIATIYGNHFIIEGNEVHNNSYWKSNQTSGISMASSANNLGGANDQFEGFSAIIRYNIIWQNENRVPEDYGSLVSGNATDGNCIINDWQRSGGYNGRVLVEQNVCYQNGAKAVQFFQSGYGVIRNNTFYHNVQTKVKNILGGLGGGGVEASVAEFDNANVVWENNLVWPADNIAASGSYSSSGVSYNNNICVGTPGQGGDPWGDADNAICNNWVSGNPGLIDPANGDFRLDPNGDAAKQGIGATYFTAQTQTVSGSDGVNAKITGGPVGGEFSMVGTQIADPNGNSFIPVGFNMQGPYIWDFTGSSSISTVAAAPNLADVWDINAIRLVTCPPPRTPGCHGRDDTRNQDLDAIIQAYTSRNIVVMITSHEWGAPYNECNTVTQDIRDKNKAYYRDLATRYGDNPYVWFNFYNEPVHVAESNALGNWFDIHAELIDEVRGAGGKNMIVVDDYGCGGQQGQSIVTPNRSAVVQRGVEMKNRDPLGRVAFSIHAYFGWGGGSVPDVMSRLQNFDAELERLGLTFMVGEAFANNYGPNMYAVANVATDLNIGLFGWTGYYAPDQFGGAVRGCGGTTGMSCPPHLANSSTNPTNLSETGKIIWNLARKVKTTSVKLTLDSEESTNNRYAQNNFDLLEQTTNDYNNRITNVDIPLAKIGALSVR